MPRCIAFRAWPRCPHTHTLSYGIIFSLTRRLCRAISSSALTHSFPTLNVSIGQQHMVPAPLAHQNEAAYIEALLLNPQVSLSFRSALLAAKVSWGPAALQEAVRLLTQAHHATESPQSSSSSTAPLAAAAAVSSASSEPSLASWSKSDLRDAIARLRLVLELNNSGQPLGAEKLKEIKREFRALSTFFPPPPSKAISGAVPRNRLSAAASSFKPLNERVAVSDSVADGQMVGNVMKVSYKPLLQPQPQSALKAKSLSVAEEFFSRITSSRSQLPPECQSAILSEYTSFQHHCFGDVDVRMVARAPHLERIKALFRASAPEALTLFAEYRLRWKKLMKVKVPALLKHVVSLSSYEQQLHIPLLLRDPKLMDLVARASALKSQTKPRADSNGVDIEQEPALSHELELHRLAERMQVWQEGHEAAISLIALAQEQTRAHMPDSLLAHVLINQRMLPSASYGENDVFIFSEASPALDATSLLPHLSWTLEELQFLELLQANVHPLIYYHMRATLLEFAIALAARRTISTQESDALLEAERAPFVSWFLMLLSGLSAKLQSQLSSLFSQRLSSLCYVFEEELLDGIEPVQVVTKRSGSKRRTAQQRRNFLPLHRLERFPPLDLPLERYCFLVHLHEQALPAHCTQLLVILHRGHMLQQRTLALYKASRRKEDAAAAANEHATDAGPEYEFAPAEQLDEDDDELNADALAEPTRPAPLDEEEDGASSSLMPLPAPAAHEPVLDLPQLLVRQRKHRVHSLSTLQHAAARLFGASSALTLGLRLHLTCHSLHEWTRIRSLACESETRLYTAFYRHKHSDHDSESSENSESSSSEAQLEGNVIAQLRAQHQQHYIHPLLEHQKSLRYAHQRLDPGFVQGVRRCAHLKLFLLNVHPEISARELMFALRRMGDVRGGEIFRERATHSVLQSELARTKALIKLQDKAAARPGGGDGGKSARAELAPPISSGNTYSRVYAAVYFSRHEELAACLTPSLALLGITYRGHSMLPRLAGSMTRIRLSGGLLSQRDSGHYNSMVAALMAHIHHVTHSTREVLNIGTRQSMQDRGILYIELSSHELAVQIAAHLVKDEPLGPKLKVSFCSATDR